jgi:phosphatidylglycerol---prolipoprotein diacylglyceryl transferase
VFATWLNNFDPFVFQIGNFGPRWYGLSYVVSALLVYWLYKRLAERGYTDIPPAKVADFITWTGLFGVLIGGRLGWIIWYGRYQEHTSPWWMFDVTSGGMASHGGIYGIVIVTFILSRLWKVSWTSIGDTLCVTAPIGLCIVRIANFWNGELYGHTTDKPWGVKFASELRESADYIHQAGGDPAIIGEADRIITAARHDPALAQRLAEILPTRHPSQLYQAMLEGALLFIILYILRTKFRMPRGVLTGLFFILYAALRIIGEIWRVPDPAWKMGSLSAGQTLSLWFFGIGLAFIIAALCAKKYEKADQMK